MSFGDIFRILPHLREITSLWNDAQPLIPKVATLEADYQRLIPRTIALWNQLEPIVNRAHALEVEIFPPPPPGPPPPPPSPAVEMVRWVQLCLNQLGEHLDVDGNPGPETKAAVARYQQARDLDADGIIGPQTIESLWRRFGAG